MLFAILIAASGAALVPAAADLALVLDGPAGAAGIRALFTTAGRHTSTLSPESIGRTLQNSVGVDLLAEQPAWGLAKRGPRALVLIRGAVGLSAPVADVKSARAALDAWLGPAGPRKAASAPRAAGNRKGLIAKIGGSPRLLVASGDNAAALVRALAHPAALSKDKALLAKATGPAWVYLKGRPPLRAAIFALEASAAGLIARGLLTSLRDPILAGAAPGPCDGAPPGCLRVAPGPAGRELLQIALTQLQAPQLPASERALIRLEGIDAQRLGDERSLPRALRITVTDAPALPSGPALSGQLELTAVAAALGRLSPLDALRGSLAAGAFAANLVYGPLLRDAGPLTLTGAAAKNGAEIELRLPLR